jgi:hypothetical protein
MPADYNNAGNGRPNAQPVSVSLASLVSALTPSTAKPGYYEVTIPNAFPAGATMRSVTLQGYWSQTLAGVSTPRHTLSIVKTVAGDTARRQVVDATKCANCHEWFEGHGGNRVIGIGTGSSAELVCVTCHVPGIASSGHTVTDAQWDARTAATVGTSAGWSSDQLRIFGEWGVSLTDPLKALQSNMPRVTNNFKDLIHGIHAGRERVTPFKDARNFNGNETLLDFRRMDFPGILNDCQTCHKANTYNVVPSKALVSTHYYRSDAFMASGGQTVANATSSMLQPNGQDLVTTPFAAACVSCHDSSLAQSHMNQNGAKIWQPRNTIGTIAESCQVCHGAGSEFDTAVVHK